MPLINLCCVCFRKLLALWDRFRAAERRPTCFVCCGQVWGRWQTRDPPSCMETDFLMKKPRAVDADQGDLAVKGFDKTCPVPFGESE